MQVRRTDKVGTEAAFHDIREYMKHVDEWFESYEMRHDVEQRRVYLATDDPNVTLDPAHFEGLEYRHTGFKRGGRSTAVAGVAGDNLTYYAGYSGGGVWRTTDAAESKARSE